MTLKLSCLIILSCIHFAIASTPAPRRIDNPNPKPSKHLIEFGWDEPDTAFMRAHIADMEKTPFDGTVFHLNGPFGNEYWGRRAFSEKGVQSSLDDLKATPFKKFTENFLRFNVCPGDVDWFDDFSALTTNAKLAAQIAHDGHAKGILFDIEQYNSPLFNYSKQRDAKTKSWDQYSTQARRRGAEVMRAFQDGFPRVTIFLTFGYTLPYEQCNGDKTKLAQADYGLLVPFLDGMVETAADGVRIVDGYELAYSFKTKEKFDEGYKRMREGVLPIVADREKYLRIMSAGFGIWMDYDWRKKGWDATDVNKNFFTPEAFEQSVHFALDRSDQYVWIYTEKPKWWTTKGPELLPKAYEDALRRAAGSL